MKTARNVTSVIFVFAFLAYGGAVLNANCGPNPYCQPPSCQDSNGCYNGNYWETRSCSWDESNKISCQSAWMFMQIESAGCGPGPWYGYVNDFNCYDTSDYPWNCGPFPPWDPNQCESVGTAACTASTGYC